MPTRPSKGGDGPSNSGSKGRGGQKATSGSAVSPEVAEEQATAITADGDGDAERPDGF